MAVGEAAETPADQQQYEQAEGVEGARETVHIAPAMTMSEPASAPPDEMNRPTAEASSEEQPRVVTFVEPGATPAGGGGGAHPKRHRVRTAAREAVEENLLPRVERIRQASNVVLDEAAYDPSLRFVLIALTLFFIFLVILLANNILG
jgi:hypothetical protein